MDEHGDEDRLGTAEVAVEEYPLWCWWGWRDEVEPSRACVAGEGEPERELALRGRDEVEAERGFRKDASVRVVLEKRSAERGAWGWLCPPPRPCWEWPMPLEMRTEDLKLIRRERAWASSASSEGMRNSRISAGAASEEVVPRVSVGVDASREGVGGMR